MTDARQLRTAIVDSLIGFIAFCTALATVIRPQQDLRVFLLMTVAAYFAAGGVRSGVVPSAKRALLVASGGIAPILLMRLTRIAFTAPLYVPLFLATATIGAIAGGWCGTLLRRRRIVAAGIVAVAAAAAGVLLSLVEAPRLMRVQNVELTYRAAPDFVVTTMDGRALHAQDLHGRVTVVAFWATWCVPCWGELPEVQHVYLKYSGDPRVEVLAVDIADHDSRDQATAFLTERKLTMPAAMDVSTDGTKGTASQSLDRHGLPQLFVLDEHWRVHWVHSGYDASEQIGEQLDSAVASLLPAK
jgi:thiol-disulfide isomerase/thioredoxin